jgi:hypothetical protein
LQANRLKELGPDYCTCVVWIENGFCRHLCLVFRLASAIWICAKVICRDRRGKCPGRWRLQGSVLDISVESSNVKIVVISVARYFTF